MRKGYTSEDVRSECRRLENAGIEYGFFYLVGICGKGRGEKGASTTAEVFNSLHPFLIGPNMLTVYPESDLYKEIKEGNWKEESEKEKYREMKILVMNLDIDTSFAAMGASNAFFHKDHLPEDKDVILSTLDRIIEETSEEELSFYRKNLKHL